jgi:hypothetical protein
MPVDWHEPRLEQMLLGAPGHYRKSYEIMFCYTLFIATSYRLIAFYHVPPHSFTLIFGYTLNNNYEKILLSFMTRLFTHECLRSFCIQVHIFTSFISLCIPFSHQRHEKIFLYPMIPPHVTYPSNRYGTSIPTVTGSARASIVGEIASSMVWAPAYNRGIFRC